MAPATSSMVRALLPRPVASRPFPPLPPAPAPPRRPARSRARRCQRGASRGMRLRRSAALQPLSRGKTGPGRRLRGSPPAGSPVGGSPLGLGEIGGWGGVASCGGHGGKAAGGGPGVALVMGSLGKAEGPEQEGRVSLMGGRGPSQNDGS